MCTRRQEHVDQELWPRRGREEALLDAAEARRRETELDSYASVDGFLAHANLGIRFGWLEYLIVLPRYHHWHHAREQAYIDVNYAIHLPLVDILMGTFKLPKDGSWPAEYGVMKLESVPDDFFRQQISPFLPPRKADA